MQVRDAWKHLTNANPKHKPLGLGIYILMHQKFIVSLKWKMFIPFIYSNSTLCNYFPFHCKSLEYRIVDFWFYYCICPVHINFDTLSHFLHHNLFIINRGCSLSPFLPLSFFNFLHNSWHYVYRLLCIIDMTNNNF